MAQIKHAWILGSDATRFPSSKGLPCALVFASISWSEWNRARFALRRICYALMGMMRPGRADALQSRAYYPCNCPQARERWRDSDHDVMSQHCVHPWLYGCHPGGRGSSDMNVVRRSVNVLRLECMIYSMCARWGPIGTHRDRHCSRARMITSHTHPKEEVAASHVCTQSSTLACG